MLPVHRLDEARILHVIEFRCIWLILTELSSPSHMSFRLLSRLPISRLLPWSFGSTFWTICSSTERSSS